MSADGAVGVEAPDDPARGRPALQPPDVSPEQDGRRMRGLDGLRAVAVVLVIGYHLAAPYPTGGLVGVDVFFVISGYLMTGILLRERQRFGRVRYGRFYARRAIRLYPSLLLAVLVVLVPGLLLAPSIGRSLEEALAAVLYLTPVTQLAVGDSGLWAHTWTLGLEEYFYLVWPISLTALVSVRCRTGTRVALLLGVGLLAYAAKLALVLDGHQVGSYLRAGGLLLGAAVGVWFDRHPIVGAPRWWAPVGLLGLALSVAAGSRAPVSWWQPVGFLVAAVSTCLLLPAVVQAHTLTSRVLGWAPLAYLGVISYELYLWHVPIARLGTLAGGGSGSEEWWWAAPLTLALAAGSHRLVQPLSAGLKRRVSY